jgi:hypothetical protein
VIEMNGLSMSTPVIGLVVQWLATIPPDGIKIEMQTSDDNHRWSEWITGVAAGSLRSRKLDV